MEQVEIKNVTVKMGKKSLVIMPDEARQLQAILKQLLEHKIMVEGKPRFVYTERPFAEQHPSWDVDLSKGKPIVKLVENDDINI